MSPPDPHSAPGLPEPLPRFAASPPNEPHSADFVAGALANPVRAIDLVLATPERVGANLVRASALGGLARVFLLASVLFAIPYGIVLAPESWWKIVVFYLGSTLICLPSLHVFASYLGQRLSLLQILVLALTVPAVAALFTFGFAPILAFLRLTMEGGSGQVPWRAISNLLLAVAALAGIVQQWRTLLAAKGAARSALFPLVLTFWHAVLVYVMARMGSLLGLGG